VAPSDGKTRGGAATTTQDWRARWEGLDGKARLSWQVTRWPSDVFLRAESDERLVAIARAGSGEAFAAIVLRHTPGLQRLARRLVGRDRAEDLVQQTFLNALAALRAGAEVEHLRGWLCQILRNTANRTSARHLIEAELDTSLPVRGSLEDAVIARLLAVEALREVARLPRRQREALLNSAIHGVSRAKLAESMGVSEGAVRQLLNRARNTLRSAVMAISPYGLARWGAGTRLSSTAGAVPELTAGAGTASGTGALLKLGAIASSAVIAAGIVVSRHDHGHIRTPAARGQSALAARRRLDDVTHGPQRRAGSARLELLASSHQRPVAAPGDEATRQTATRSPAKRRRSTSNHVSGEGAGESPAAPSPTDGGLPQSGGGGSEGGNGSSVSTATSGSDGATATTAASPSTGSDGGTSSPGGQVAGVPSSDGGSSSTTTSTDGGSSSGGG
jgi:RNA polymerase sigma factor (sigma-70 family)